MTLDEAKAMLAHAGIDATDYYMPPLSDPDLAAAYILVVFSEPSESAIPQPAGTEERSSQ